MSYSARDRDRHRLAVSAVTGVVTVGSLTAVGWLAGAAAHDQAADQAARQAALTRARAEYATALARSRGAARPPLKQRPTRVRVTTRYVRGTATAAVGSGGTVSTPASAGSRDGSGSGGPSSGGGPGPSTPAPPPPPPPPTSGS